MIQLQGAASLVGADVQADRSLLVGIKPNNPGALGSYRKGLSSGTMAAALTGASPVYSFRYGAANLAVVKRISISLGDLVGFAAGLVLIQGFIARAFSASDSGGTGGTLTANNAKLRTAYATTGVSDIRISSTAALTPGTRTLDADPFCTISGSVITTAGQPPELDIIELFRAMPGDQPLVLAANEGFVIQATVPATGTWQFSVDTSWDELASW